MLLPVGQGALLVSWLSHRLGRAANGGHYVLPEAPIARESVKVYLAPPPKYETIAMLEASDLGANGFSAQSRTNKIMKRMKSEAAELGANGILLGGIDTHTRVNGSVVNGVGYVSSQTNKLGKTIAIYVAAE
jgi:hypothetical protein